MPQGLRIGELSAQTGLSIHTLRWYESQGLMPGVIRDQGGRRVYSDLHAGWIDLIDRLRCTGMSIAQIREYAALVKQGSRSLQRRRTFLAAHRMRVETRIAEWQEALELIDHKIGFYGQWIATGKRPVVELPVKLRSGRIKVKTKRRKL